MYQGATVIISREDIILSLESLGIGKKDYSRNTGAAEEWTKGICSHVGRAEVLKVGLFDRGRQRRKEEETKSSIKFFSCIYEPVSFMDFTSSQNHNTETNPGLLLFASVFCFYLAFILCLFQVEFTPDQIEGEEDVFLFCA